MDSLQLYLLWCYLLDHELFPALVAPEAVSMVHLICSGHPVSSDVHHAVAAALWRMQDVNLSVKNTHSNSSLLYDEMEKMGGGLTTLLLSVTTFDLAGDNGAGVFFDSVIFSGFVLP